MTRRIHIPGPHRQTGVVVHLARRVTAARSLCGRWLPVATADDGEALCWAPGSKRLPGEAFCWAVQPGPKPADAPEWGDFEAEGASMDDTADAIRAEDRRRYDGEDGTPLCLRCRDAALGLLWDDGRLRMPVVP